MLLGKFDVFQVYGRPGFFITQRVAKDDDRMFVLDEKSIRTEPIVRDYPAATLHLRPMLAA